MHFSSSSTEKNSKKGLYGYFLVGLSLSITFLIASEEAEFLYTVFDRWALEKSVALALMNAVVPVAVVGAFGGRGEGGHASPVVVAELFRFRIPVFLLGIIVLSFASYQTVRKYIGEISSKNWAERRISTLEAQIARNERLLKSLEGQPTNTAVTVRRIQALEEERNAVEVNPGMSEAEAWIKVVLLTGVRVVLWFLAISMSRRGFELMGRSSEVRRRFNSHMIGERLQRLRKNKDLDVSVVIGGERRKVSATHRSILVNYALPFLESLVEGNPSKTT